MYFWTTDAVHYHSMYRCPLKRQAPKEERGWGEEPPADLEPCPSCIVPHETRRSELARFVLKSA